MTRQPRSIWSPLAHPLFRSLWIASAASHIGSYMTDVGQGWLMSSLTPSPLIVSLLLTAESLPFFALGLPAGALADIVDRSEEHTSELQSPYDLVCRLLLEKKKSKSPSPSTSRTLRPMRVMSFMFTATYAESEISTPMCAMGEPSGPMLHGTTYILRPRMLP